MDSTPARSIRASSGSLSSPTPSPPPASAVLPPVPTNQPRIANKQARRTGLESGSDSSELTDEDDVKQRAKKKKKRGRKPRKVIPTTTTVDREQSSRRAHSRGTSESTVNGTHNGSGSTSTSGSQALSNSRSSRRSGVVVPPAMWEWAYKKTKQPVNELGLDITPRDDSPSRSSSGPEQTKAATDPAQLSDGEIEDPPATSTSEPPPRRHDKPASAAERPTISISTGPATDDISTPISAPNTSATTPRPSPTPVQPESNSKKPSPTPDESHSAVSGNPDETRSDTDMPVDEPEPGELVESSKPATRKLAAQEPEPEPEDEPAPGDDSKASIDPEPEPEPEEEPEPEPEPEVEPGPEPEAEIEIDPDMQPPHRAEALDVLAAMEVRFAELRERLYADKMEEAAREEAMILDGTHPELVFFQRELDARRARRKQLAETRRTLEIGWCATMRRAEESAAWSEWRHARDELRDNMRTECARKRRRLEREKRSAERPATVRPIPAAPISLPQPPSLKSLLKLHANPQRASVPVRATPALTPLSYADALADLEQMTPRRPVFYQPPPISYASEEEAYARSRGYGYRSMNGAASSSTMGPAPGTRVDGGPGPQYPPALVHSYVVGPAPAWDGSSGRRRDPRLDRDRERDREREPRVDRDRERDRDPRLDREREREPPYGATDKEDKRPASSSAVWPTTELDHDPWDRDQTREWQRRMERDQRERDRERDRPLSTPFTMQPYVNLSTGVDADMGGSSSRPLSRNVER
ncbi:hypothetical protein ACGC1H_007170 [Rhizoctonia solani]|uniref:Sds3-like-domain-containing protein n=1 Tax=Rhizoctonia solani TaxID=456999 RepID=A0A8H2X821_9AGAM|nr:unnamed protein product [Rhizoctonia solani]